MRSLLLLLSFWLLALPALAAPHLRVVQWSDVHYGNELYSATAWAEAERVGLGEHPDVVVLTGDQADDKCSVTECQRRQNAMLDELAPRLAHVPFVVALGNDDLEENYQTPPEVLHDAIEPYRRHFGARCPFDDLGNATWSIGGYTWLSFNSIIFSPKNHYAQRAEQARRTLAWLGSHLAAARGRPVVLVTHIPPTVDLFDGHAAWHPEAIDALAALLEQHRGPVIILCGHYHRNEIHAFALSHGRAVPVLVAGSLSLKYGQMANWRSWDWTPSSLSWTLHYPGHADWQQACTIDRPFQQTWYRAFSTRLHQDSHYYDVYMRDLWAHNIGWPALAAPLLARQSILDQLWWPLLPK
ncbi:MAG: metallophosphoesterase family protein [Candidatus Xenobia bacterium]